MRERDESGLEIRRIILLTRLRDTPRGLTMDQLVRDCLKVASFRIHGIPLWDTVRLVLQSLIDDELVQAKTKFALTAKGRDYLGDPLKWDIEIGSAEEVEKKLFWNSIYDVFNRAYARLRARA